MQTSAMADQRKVPNIIITYLHTFWNINFKETCNRSSFHIYYITVMDSSILEQYLHIKHKETYVKVMQFSEFTLWQKFLSIHVEHKFAICEWCNKQCPQWLVMGDILVCHCCLIHDTCNKQCLQWLVMGDISVCHC